MLGFTIRPFTTNLPVNPKTQLQAVCSIYEIGTYIRGKMHHSDRCWIADRSRQAQFHGFRCSTTGTTFRTTRLYTRLTAKEVRRQLLENKGYNPSHVPKERSMRDLLNVLGFHPRKVVKSKPLRKIKETDAIFNSVHQVNQQADDDPGTVRISLDTKAMVVIGDLSRGGKSRQGEHALDHDLEPEQKLTPFGLFRPDTNQTWLYFTSGSATADFMVDRLQEHWPELKKTVILHIPC